jgi:hypothetical protein
MKALGRDELSGYHIDQVLLEIFSRKLVLI